MEFLILIVVAVILIVIIKSKNKSEQKLEDLHNRLDDLMRELKNIKQNQIDFLNPKEEKPIAFDESIKPVLPLPTLPKPEPQPIVEKILEQKVPPVTSPQKETIATTSFVKQVTPPTKRPNFFERNPDLEKFIGENLANKIGIAILVLGVGFFVKYAIDQEWINEIGRVFIGLLCGGALLAVAHRLSKTFKTFSSVLVGGGIAMLYLTITIAFQQYHIFSQTVAFVIMIIITGFTVFLSLGYNKIELAILAILGGFGSPFMVSTGEGNYIVLFTYILILDLGMLTLAYFKKWKLINVISYAFTILLFGSWLISKFDNENILMIKGSLIFATLFYFTFFAMSIVNNLKEHTAFKAFEFSLILSNTLLYYSEGMFILHNNFGMIYRGLFTTLLAIFNFGFAYSLYKRASVDRNLVFLLIGLVLTFISLAAPIQLEGNHITLFWAAEAVLLLWLSQKSEINLMKIASVIVLILMIISLAMDWNKIYRGSLTTPMLIIFNKGYITGIFSIVSYSLTFYLLKNERENSFINVPQYKNILSFLIIVVLYLTNLFELRYQLDMFSLNWEAQTISVGIYNMIFILGLLLFEKKIIVPEKIRPWLASLGILGIIAHLSVYQPALKDARENYFLNAGSFLALGLHYIYLVVVIFVSFQSIFLFRTLSELNIKTRNLYAWIFVAFFVHLASTELDTSILLLLCKDKNSYWHLLEQNHKIGFPILWGISSFILIVYGLRRKNKTVRIISLTLFFITLIKLFLIDIRGISEGGKIAAFISLGILLLIVSFMYQKLKRILLDNEAEIKKELE